MVAFQERAPLIGEQVLPANVGSDPQDKVEKQTLSFKFKPEQPGKYFAACVTPGRRRQRLRDVVHGTQGRLARRLRGLLRRQPLALRVPG